jgi:endonuclease-3
MANPNRTALLNKTHRVLKQHYKPVPIPSDRPLLEHILYACCLENAPYDAADRIYEHLSKSFFDWNEVRVSTVTELSEAMHNLPDPTAAAANLKRVLQGVFESTYSFELESLKKQNISQAIKHLEKLGGSTPFVLAYVTQAALGGHSIPLDRGALELLFVLGIISESEARSGRISGFERVIPKNKGAEFGSLLHQLAADYHAYPFSPNVRKLILSINSDAKDRFPKRGAKKEPEKPAEPLAAKKGHPEKQDGKPAEKPSDKAASKQGERAAEKGGERHPEKHAAKPLEKHAAKQAQQSSGNRPDPPAEKSGAKKKPAEQKAASKSHAVSPKRKPATKQLAKRKPR